MFPLLLSQLEACHTSELYYRHIAERILERILELWVSITTSMCYKCSIFLKILLTRFRRAVIGGLNNLFLSHPERKHRRLTLQFRSLSPPSHSLDVLHRSYSINPLLLLLPLLKEQSLRTKLELGRKGHLPASPTPPQQRYTARPASAPGPIWCPRLRQRRGCS